jgi:hypothetical protein
MTDEMQSYLYKSWEGCVQVCLSTGAELGPYLKHTVIPLMSLKQMEKNIITEAIRN